MRDESLSNVKILFVEDEPAHQRLLERSLVSERPFVQVDIAKNGKEFKQFIFHNRYDCIICDYNLPDYTADNLIKETKEHLQDCPILVISSNADQQVAVSSMRSGSVDFIPKKEALFPTLLWPRVKHAILESRKQNLRKRISERRQKELVRLVETDPLTGLYNRRYLEERLKNGAYQNERRRDMACIMVDIDFFKSINDTYGHAKGDEVLKRVAGIISTNLGQGDAAIRYGGEEMLVLQISTTKADAWIWCEEIRKQIAMQVFQSNDETFTTSVSMGLTCFPTIHMSHEKITQADKAMYLAKSKGRNMVCTDDMVAALEILETIRKKRLPDTESRWHAFINEFKDRMGPTQKSHVIEHCVHVAKIVEELGEAMNLPEKLIKKARLAGLLHDIGKCFIPEELLAQSTPLSQEQQSLLQQYSEYSAVISIGLGVKGNIADWIDYPHLPYYSNTTKSDIPLVAKLLAVADAFSAMVSNRPYQRLRSIQEAMAELKQEAGYQFDPDIIKLTEKIENLT